MNNVERSGKVEEEETLDVVKYNVPEKKVQHLLLIYFLRDKLGFNTRFVP